MYSIYSYGMKNEYILQMKYKTDGKTSCNCRGQDSYASKGGY